MPGDYERLAYETGLRALDKQERLLEELRARTGLLLAACSLAASFLGSDALKDSAPVGLVLVALAAFLLCVGASVYVLTPKSDLIFSLSATGLYEGLYEVREDLSEVHRRLAYDLARFWQGNDEIVRKLVRSYRCAAGALVVEIVSLMALVSDRLL